MANLEGKLSETSNIVVYTKANGYLSALQNKMSDSGIGTLNIKNAYISKYEIVEQLRSSLKEDYRVAAPPGVSFEGDFAKLTPLLNTDNPITDIGKIPGDYEMLEDYLNKCATLAKGAFEPSLGEPFAVNGTTIYPIPNTTELDARRFGRVFYFETPFNKSQKDWLINNAPLYGFVMYEDYALYYIGFVEIKSLVASQGIQKVVNRFQREAIPAGQINLTVSAVQAAADPIQPTIEQTPNGTMYFSNPSNPLLVVFGGIDVDGEPSGKYMPPYFDGKYDKYNIWIANSSRVDGEKSYNEVVEYLGQKGANPSTRILYCFSGGYSPGSKLITNGKINDFSRVLLVDIWMKNINTWPNWVKTDASKASYFYSVYGPGGGPPNGVAQQDSIITSLGYPTPKSADTAHFINNHMKTNVLAVATL